MKKLAIVGSGTETRDLAPWGDKSFDIWVFNEAGNSEWCKRFDAVFQMHTPEIYTGHNTKDPHHWEWLQQKRSKPIYMQAFDNRVPDCVEYPKYPAFSLVYMDYFTSTFAYMCALAKMEGYEQVDIYGVEMSFSEYQYQAEGFRFWVGYLLGAGIEVNLHSGRKLFDAPLYGYEGAFAFGADHFAARARVLDSQWNAAEKNLQNIKKAIERATERLEFEKVTALVVDYQNQALQVGEYAGALAEAERYQGFGDRGADRGGFEFAAATGQAKTEESRVQMYHYGGMIEYVWNIWKQTKRADAANQMSQFIETMGKHAYDTGAHIGIYKENCAYMLEYDARVQANGGVKILEPA